MAMIKCPKCHHHISSMAKVCPECGASVESEQVEENMKSEPVRQQTLRQSTFARNLLIVVVSLVLLLIGALFYYDYQAGMQREQRAYELLQDCSNPDFYEDFIIRFPKSQYIDEVRERYKAVAALQGEWQKLIDGGSREDLQQFVRQHPTSPYVKVAQGRIDSLDWVEAKQRRSLEAINQYMLAHPNGYYIDQAEIMRQSMERAQEEAAALAAAQRDSLEAAESESAQ